VGWQASFLGGIYGEPPPYEWFNYMMYSYGEWIDYLSKQTEELPTSKPSITTMLWPMSPDFRVTSFTYRRESNDNFFQDASYAECLLTRNGSATYLTSTTTGISQGGSRATVYVNRDGILKIQLSSNYARQNFWDSVADFTMENRNLGGGNNIIAQGSFANVYHGIVATVESDSNKTDRRQYNCLNLVHSALFDYRFDGDIQYRPSPCKLALNCSAGGTLHFPVSRRDRVYFSIVIRYVFASTDSSNRGTEIGRDTANGLQKITGEFYRNLIISHLA
jgi:hypothetical protein